MIEALPAWPAIIWSRNASLPIGDVMILAKESRAVAILAQNLRNHGAAFRNLPAVSWITGTTLRYNPRASGMMIASCQERRPGWRAERRCVESSVKQTTFCQPV